MWSFEDVLAVAPKTISVEWEKKRGLYYAWSNYKRISVHIYEINGCCGKTLGRRNFCIFFLFRQARSTDVSNEPPPIFCARGLIFSFFFCFVVFHYFLLATTHINLVMGRHANERVYIIKNVNRNHLHILGVDFHNFFFNKALNWTNLRLRPSFAQYINNDAVCAIILKKKNIFLIR